MSRRRQSYAPFATIVAQGTINRRDLQRRRIPSGQGRRALKQQAAIFVGAMALGLIAAGDAGAQGFYYYGPGFYGSRYYRPGLPPGQIMQIVRQAGYAPLSAPARRGPTYVVVAMGRSGQVRVVVDAYGGEIVGVRPVLAMAPYGAPAPYDPRLGPAPIPPGELPPAYGPGGGPDGPGAAGEAPHTGSVGVNRTPQMQPPRPIPNQQLATAPNAPATAAPPPARTPIPRPRPNVEAKAANAAAPAAAATPAPAAASPSTASPNEVPEAPPAPRKPSQPTPLVPVAPLD